MDRMITSEHYGGRVHNARVVRLIECLPPPCLLPARRCHRSVAPEDTPKQTLYIAEPPRRMAVAYGLSWLRSPPFLLQWNSDFSKYFDARWMYERRSQGVAGGAGRGGAGRAASRSSRLVHRSAGVSDARLRSRRLSYSSFIFFFYSFNLSLEPHK